MPLWLAPVARFFATLLGFVKDALLIKAGKDMQIKADTQKVVEIQNEQLKAALALPVNRDDLIRRLRDPKDGL